MIKKLQRLERQIAEERGEFSLFGLFQREDSYDRWDVVAAAPWFPKREGDAIRFIADHLKPAVGKAGLMMISMIVPLRDTDPFLAAAHEAVEVRHGLRKVNNISFGGVPIEVGYVITSIKPDAPKRKKPARRRPHHMPA